MRVVRGELRRETLGTPVLDLWPTCCAAVPDVSRRSLPLTSWIGVATVVGVDDFSATCFAVGVLSSVDGDALLSILSEDRRAGVATTMLHEVTSVALVSGCGTSIESDCQS